MLLPWTWHCTFRSRAWATRWLSIIAFCSFAAVITKTRVIYITIQSPCTFDHLTGVFTTRVSVTATAAGSRSSSRLVTIDAYPHWPIQQTLIFKNWLKEFGILHQGILKHMPPFPQKMASPKVLSPRIKQKKTIPFMIQMLCWIFHN